MSESDIIAAFEKKYSAELAFLRELMSIPNIINILKDYCTKSPEKHISHTPRLIRPKNFNKDSKPKVSNELNKSTTEHQKAEIKRPQTTLQEKVKKNIKENEEDHKTFVPKFIRKTDKSPAKPKLPESKNTEINKINKNNKPKEIKKEHKKTKYIVKKTKDEKIEEKTTENLLTSQKKSDKPKGDEPEEIHVSNSDIYNPKNLELELKNEKIDFKPAGDDENMSIPHEKDDEEKLHDIHDEEPKNTVDHNSKVLHDHSELILRHFPIWFWMSKIVYSYLPKEEMSKIAVSSKIFLEKYVSMQLKRLNDLLSQNSINSAKLISVF